MHWPCSIKLVSTFMVLVSGAGMVLLSSPDALGSEAFERSNTNSDESPDIALLRQIEERVLPLPLVEGGVFLPLRERLRTGLPPWVGQGSASFELACLLPGHKVFNILCFADVGIVCLHFLAELWAAVSTVSR